MTRRPDIQPDLFAGHLANVPARAKKVLAKIDEVINMFPEPLPTHLILYPKDWDYMNELIIKLTNGKSDLRTHHYRGVELRRK